MFQHSNPGDSSSFPYLRALWSVCTFPSPCRSPILSPRVRRWLRLFCPFSSSYGSFNDTANVYMWVRPDICPDYLLSSSNDFRGRLRRRYRCRLRRFLRLFRRRNNHSSHRTRRSRAIEAERMRRKQCRTFREHSIDSDISSKSLSESKPAQEGTGLAKKKKRTGHLLRARVQRRSLFKRKLGVLTLVSQILASARAFLLKSAAGNIYVYGVRCTSIPQKLRHCLVGLSRARQTLPTNPATSRAPPRDIFAEPGEIAPRGCRV